MKITKASKSNIDDIVDLWKEFMEHNSRMDSYDTMGIHGPSEMRTQLEALITDDSALVLVALKVNRVIGYSVSLISQRPSFFDNTEFGFISDIAVTTEERRNGAGRMMLDQIIGWFKSKQINRVETSVTAMNNIGNAFWDKQGFRDYERVLYLDL